MLTLTTTDMPGRSRRCAATPGGHFDAHRQPLHDLGEIAGRIVRRQQREHRARGRRKACHRALDGMFGQRVDADRNRLAGAQLRQLRLLEVGFDIDVAERHQARNALAGLDVVARLHARDC